MLPSCVSPQQMYRSREWSAVINPSRVVSRDWDVSPQPIYHSRGWSAVINPSQVVSRDWDVSKSRLTKTEINWSRSINGSYITFP